MILVTGASGFVGRHVTRALAESGVRVRAMVRTARGAAALDGVACVVHLVAIRQGKDERFERIMSRGTRDLVDAARGAGVGRFVHMSALGTNEETKDLVPYYRAKWEMEQTVQGSGLPYVVFRPSFVFGADGGALPRFVRIARLFPLTPVIGPGTQRLQPIWIDDVVRAVRLAVDGEGSNGPVELGGPDPVTWSDFWRRLKTALGTRRPSIHVPFWLARGPAAMFERIPPALVTRDQLRMLEGPDNVVSDGGASMRRLGLEERIGLEEQLRRGVGGG